MIEQLQKQFQEVAPKGEFASLRFVREKNETLSVRQDVVQPVSISEDMGVMITVHDGGGMGYAATSDLSTEGLKRAGEQALEWAKRTAGKSVLDYVRNGRRGRFLFHGVIPSLENNLLLALI